MGHVGMASSSVASDAFTAQIAPQLRGPQPYMAQADTRVGRGALLGLSESQGQRSRASTEMNLWSTGEQQVPMKHDIEAAFSWMLSALSIVAVSAAGGLWLRARSRAIKEKHAQTEMTGSNSIVWADQSKVAVAAFTSRPKEPIASGIAATKERIAVAQLEDELSAKPLPCVWDPLGLSADNKPLRRRSEEFKNGRVAMLTTIGYTLTAALPADASYGYKGVLEGSEVCAMKPLVYVIYPLCDPVYMVSPIYLYPLVGFVSFALTTIIQLLIPATQPDEDLR